MRVIKLYIDKLGKKYMKKILLSSMLSLLSLSLWAVTASPYPFEMTLPEISEEKQTIIEEIVKLQVIWMENFAKEYPNLADNARMIHTSDDGAYNTSYYADQKPCYLC